MLFAGKIADQSGRKPVAIVGVFVFGDGLTALFTGVEGSLFLSGRFFQGSRRRLPCGGNSPPCATRFDEHRRAKSAVIIEWIGLYCKAGTRPG